MRKVRLTLLIVLLLLIAAGGLYYWQSSPAKLALSHISALQQGGKPDGLEPQVKAITYNHVEEGQRKWSLMADSGDYDPKTGNISLQKVQITFYQQDGGQLYVEGDVGDYDQAGQVVVLTGNVFGRNHQGVTIRTSRLVYTEAQRMVETDREVTVAGPTFSITSLGMKAYIDPEQVFFEKQVDSTFWPKEDNRQDNQEQSGLAMSNIDRL